MTVGQYCQFLNAVAATDTYGLYNNDMALGSAFGRGYPTVGIIQSGSPGTYSYSVTGSYSQGVNCPIFDVTWGDAARFCNWLQNGQPTGAEGPDATESGAYTLNGATSDAALLAVTRNVGAAYFIPTENEWYKAAYYKGGGTNAGYWIYPTRSNTVPINILDSTGTNNANYAAGPPNYYSDPTNYLTPVGAFANSPGPYGTFDQAGDVWQPNETIVAGSYRGLRGGEWDGGPGISSFRTGGSPSGYANMVGFRVASSLPEPNCLVMLLVAAVTLSVCFFRRRCQLR